MSKENREPKPESVTVTQSPGSNVSSGAEPAPSPPQIEELRAQAAKAAENWDRLLRCTAEFDNYKKRAARERHDAIRYANEALMQKLLPVLDNFDAAIAAVQSSGADSSGSLLTGVTMIQQQLRTVLSEAGLEEVEAHGKPFDPNLHEAVSQSESTEHPEGHVMQQLRKGYRLRDRLLRPATVVVARPPSPA
jgi:molecular chaperone GrpE